MAKQERDERQPGLPPVVQPGRPRGRKCAVASVEEQERGSSRNDMLLVATASMRDSY